MPSSPVTPAAACMLGGRTRLVVLVQLLLLLGRSWSGMSMRGALVLVLMRCRVGMMSLTLRLPLHLTWLLLLVR
jgi:hypothetical protein